MRDNYSSTYLVDMVFCIDTTGSMAHIIDIVKANAINLYDDIANTLEKKNKFVNKMRVRIIAFKDYLADKDEAMLESDFFNLPEEAADLKDCVSALTADGGGDIPEDGLEALAYAIDSDWASGGLKKRHVIVVWSDAPTHPIGYGEAAPNYPADLPKSFGELSGWWDQKMGIGSKRLLMFTPPEPEWSRIAANWENVIHVSTIGEGLSELDYQMILEAISNSI